MDARVFGAIRLADQSSSLNRLPSSINTLKPSVKYVLSGEDGIPVADHPSKSGQRIGPLMVLFRKLLSDFEEVVNTVPVVERDDCAGIFCRQPKVLHERFDGFVGQLR